MAYNRTKAVEYAHRWAFDRNPNYYNFSGIGGDCTNFVSQCLLAGGARMNYTKDYGWYYNSVDDRAPAWTGVKNLFQFLIANKAEGPYGTLIPLSEIQEGDVVQLSFLQDTFTHSLLVVETGNSRGIQNTMDNVLIATHTIDSDCRPLSSYDVVDMGFIKIDAR